MYSLPRPHLILTLLKIALLGVLVKNNLVVGSEIGVHSTKATYDTDLVKNSTVG